MFIERGGVSQPAYILYNTMHIVHTCKAHHKIQNDKVLCTYFYKAMFFYPFIMYRMYHIISNVCMYHTHVHRETLWCSAKLEVKRIATGQQRRCGWPPCCCCYFCCCCWYGCDAWLRCTADRERQTHTRCCCCTATATAVVVRRAGGVLLCIMLREVHTNHITFFKQPQPIHHSILIFATTAVHTENNHLPAVTKQVSWRYIV